MTADEIISLAKAGFSAQQIAALSSQPSQPAQPVQSVGNPLQYGTPQHFPVSAPAQNSSVPLDAMAQQIQQLTSAVQQSNIMMASQPQVQTADDVLAEIINPPSVVQQQNNK